MAAELDGELALAVGHGGLGSAAVGAGTGAAFYGWTPGFGLHLSWAEMALGGMTPAEALQTVTLNTARALRATDAPGMVEAGKVADLVLLDANPLQAIWNTTKIRAVIASGRYFDRAALDKLEPMGVGVAEKKVRRSLRPPWDVTAN